MQEPLILVCVPQPKQIRTQVRGRIGPSLKGKAEQISQLRGTEAFIPLEFNGLYCDRGGLRFQNWMGRSNDKQNKQDRNSG